MAKNRREINVKGLGNLQVRETNPSAAAEPTDLGFLGGTTFEDVYDMEEIKDEKGALIDVKERGQSVSVASSLLQSSKTAIDIMKAAAGKIHAARYFGEENNNVFKWFALNQIRIIPGIKLDFKPGTRTIPIMLKSLKQGELAYDVPLYHLIEVAGLMYLSGLKFWVSPRNGENLESARLLDASFYNQRGLITSDYTTIWQQGTPANFLRFDGVNDAVDFGDILDDDGTTDFYFEIWARVQAADGTAQELMAKKSLSAGNTAGWSIYRNASNQIVFTIGSGSAAANVVSAGTLLQNIWKKIGVSVDRNGNGQVYLNGVASGSPVAVSAIGTGTNAGSLYLGRDGTNFGQVDLSDARIYTFVAGSLPTDIGATIEPAHYAAEKTFHGL